MTDTPPLPFWMVTVAPKVTAPDGKKHSSTSSTSSNSSTSHSSTVLLSCFMKTSVRHIHVLRSPIPIVPPLGAVSFWHDTEEKKEIQIDDKERCYFGATYSLENMVMSKNI